MASVDGMEMVACCCLKELLLLSGTRLPLPLLTNTVWIYFVAVWYIWKIAKENPTQYVHVSVCVRPVYSCLESLLERHTHIQGHMISSPLPTHPLFPVKSNTPIFLALTRKALQTPWKTFPLSPTQVSSPQNGAFWDLHRHLYEDCSTFTVEMPVLSQDRNNLLYLCLLLTLNEYEMKLTDSFLAHFSTHNTVIKSYFHSLNTSTTS